MRLIVSTALAFLWLVVVPAQAAIVSHLALPDEQAPSRPAHLPAEWQVGFVREPVFDSRMLVVEVGTEHRETVLLVHGLGQNGHRDWMGVIPELARHYHVLAIDLPGFGFSDQPQGRYSPSQYARVLNWLIEQNGREKVHLVGHSMGGAVALRFATGFPDKLHGLVLVSVAGVLERSAFAQHSSALPLEMDSVPAVVKNLAEDQLRQWGGKLLDMANNLPDPVNLLRQSNLAWDSLLSDRPNVNAALALVGENFTAALEQMAVPTLIIWGEEDPVAPLRTGYLLEGSLSNAELVVFADVGHVPMQRRSQFNDLLQSFLSGQRKPATDAPDVTGSGPAEDLFCQGHQDKRYEGRYKTIRLVACNGILLENVQAEAIELENSEVTMRNVQVTAKGVALKANHSQVMATNIKLDGTEAIRAGNSRLDIAGASLRGHEKAVVATSDSRFIFSVSKAYTTDYEDELHGVYRLGERAE